MPSSEYNKDKISEAATNYDRTITLSLSPEQYERLFLRPSVGIGARKLGDPTLLGFLSFLVPYSTAMFSLLKFRHADPSSLTSISGSFIFYGGIGMVIAGLLEFILGNTFTMCVFIFYGAHWTNQGYSASPLIGLAESYASDGPGKIGALAPEYNSAQGHYNVVLCICSFVFMLGALRKNVPYLMVFGSLVILYALLAAGYYNLANNPTEGGLEHSYHLWKIGGGIGFYAMMWGWYLSIIEVCKSTGVPCPLPRMDLSGKVFPNSERGGTAVLDKVNSTV